MSALDGDTIEQLLRREMSRSARVILTMKDRQVDPHLSAEVADALRRQILDELNRFAAVSIFVAQAAADDCPINELALPYVRDSFRAAG